MLKIYLLALSLFAASQAGAAPADWLSTELEAELAKGPVSVFCEQVLIDAPGGQDYLKFTLTQVPGLVARLKKVQFSDVKMGSQGSGKGAKIDWHLDFDCAKTNLGDGSGAFGTCAGSGISSDGRTSGEWGVFIEQHFHSKVLLAKIFTGPGTAADGGSNRSELICRMAKKE